MMLPLLLYINTLMKHVINEHNLILRAAAHYVLFFSFVRLSLSLSLSLCAPFFAYVRINAYIFYIIFEMNRLCWSPSFLPSLSHSCSAFLSSSFNFFFIFFVVAVVVPLKCSIHLISSLVFSFVFSCSLLPASQFQESYK